MTGRLSSNDPNLQNIPIRTPEGRRVREAFVAPPGHVHRQRRLLADRAAHHGPHQRRRRACCAPSPRAWTCTAPPPARSSACRSAEVTREQRRYAKTINFGLIYGMGAFGLAQNAGHRAEGGAATTSTATSRASPACKRYMDETKARAAEQGYVETAVRPPPLAARDPRRQRPAPRRRRAPGDQRADAGHGGRPDQAGDDRGAGRAGPRAARARAMVMQVHDELVFEVPEAELDWASEAVPRLMAGVAAAEGAAAGRGGRRRRTGTKHIS